MEPGVTKPNIRRGFALVTVLIITAVGLLFGAGSLLLFKFQCQQRIDRQHELEKVYAVRSTLNYIRLNNTEEITSDGKPFEYYTGSDRRLRLLVKPVQAIFPDPNNVSHFMMETNNNARNFTIPWPNQYNYKLDYEYGAVGMSNDVSLTESHVRNFYQGKTYGLVFPDVMATNQVSSTLSETNNVKWWVNIGMPGTGGWLQEEYGRRYYFNPLLYVDGKTRTDIMRLCIIRNVTNSSNKVGCKHGWPLSKRGERAFVFQISPNGGSSNDKKSNNATMSLHEYECVDESGRVLIKELIPPMVNCPSLCQMGLQIANNQISIFYIDNNQTSNAGCVLSDSVQMDTEMYKYFAEDVLIDGIQYRGVITNAYGKVQAPEVRAVLEVEAASDKRNDQSVNREDLDALTNFRVTPAYQYDIFLEHPACVTNRATVAQRRLVGEWRRNGKNYTVLTYDTHGTEHKGFRRDEREAERKNGR